MAYEPTVWACGDTITADKLNKLENGLAECCGGGSAPLVVHVVESEQLCGGEPLLMLDKTWQEIRNAFPNVVVDESVGDLILLEHVESMFSNGAEYIVKFGFGLESLSTDSANGYPQQRCEQNA